MKSEELYHIYSSIEYEQRLPKHLKNSNKTNEEENYCKSLKSKVSGLGIVDKGRERKKLSDK